MHIEIIIRQEERDDIMKVMHTLKEGEVISTAAIAKKASYNPHRTRFIINDLLERNLIERVVEKKFNDRYIRYSYRVVRQ